MCPLTTDSVRSFFIILLIGYLYCKHKLRFVISRKRGPVAHFDMFHLGSIQKFNLWVKSIILTKTVMFWTVIKCVKRSASKRPFFLLMCVHTDLIVLLWRSLAFDDLDLYKCTHLKWLTGSVGIYCKHPIDVLHSVPSNDYLSESQRKIKYGRKRHRTEENIPLADLSSGADVRNDS